MGIDVELVLEKIGVDYEESGDRLMVCCPYHNDTNPSCGLWKSSGYFRCFACGEEGSLVDFVSHVEGISVREAVRIVKGQTSLTDLEQTIGRILDKSETPLQYFKLSSFEKLFPPVISDKRGFDYLLERGLTKKTIKRFNARWGGDSGKYRFRVIFPIFTPESKLLAYVGRAIYSDMVPKTRKNRSPHRTLFGLKELLEVVPDPKNLVIVEGEFDAMYLQQHGIPAVANMGTSPMTPEKIRQLRKYSKRRVIMSYDGDDAGLTAMYGNEKREGQISILSKHLPTTSIQLPEGRDPNDLDAGEIADLYGEWRTECLIS